jgi:LuxR family maltose regulon positive regulatory protein
MQQHSLLQTKLYIPPTRPGLVSRPRLIERLNAGLHQKLTLISAPAGFGKTTLLSEWATRGAEPELGVAWLSLDAGDNDPARFWQYTIAALQTVRPGMGEAWLDVFHSLPPPDIETIVTSLLNEITLIPHPLVLVLDDYHVIDTKPIHTDVAFVLDHLPPQVHLIMATRSDPPLPLSRLRGRGHLSELRTEDLRFTTSEAATFLNKVMGLQLSAEDVAGLESRTEGWIVGLQMAALSLQGRGRLDATRFIGAFTGSHRFVLDYLSDEVISQQPEEVQAFLLSTAILDRLSGPLCDHVTGQDNGQPMLERLDAANLFVIPLDDERRWYRYHHLFATLLQSRLEQAQPDRVSALHLRASEWYKANGLLPEAVRHAFAAGHVDRVAALVSGHALTMLEHGEIATLKGWLDTLSDEVVRSHPWLCISVAWVAVFSGQMDQVEPLLRDAGLAAGGLDPPARSPVLSKAEREHLDGHAAAIRATVAFLEGSESRTVSLAREALELLPAQDSMARGWATVILGLMSYQSNDLAVADQVLSEAVAISQASGHGHVAVVALSNLAALQMDRGQLSKAAATLRDALRLAGDYAHRTGRQLLGSSSAHAYLGVLLYQWNDLHDALAHLREAAKLSERRGEPLRVAITHLHLAQALQSIGDAQGSLDAIATSRDAAAHSLSPWIAARVARVEAWLHLKQGNPAAASRWAAEHEGAANRYVDRFDYWSGCLVKARFDIMQDGLDRALSLLTDVSEAARIAGAHYYQIESLVLQAIAWQAQGRIEEALAVLERALALAEPEGYVRTFVDEGEPMAEMLRQAVVRGVKPDYVASLLAAFEADRKDRQHETGLDPSSPGTPPSGLVEVLSERELEVLRLLAAGLSNREIAEQLFLSIGTVKKYTSNIYGKLGVHNRTMAAAKARELHLL